MKKNNAPIDPLYQLFEHNLFHRNYEDITAFTREVAEEYLAYLDSTNAHVPFHYRGGLLKDLENETHEMLVKKMYGCTKPSEYRKGGSVMQVEHTDHIPQQTKNASAKKPS